jgi:hypothetical protein
MPKPPASSSPSNPSGLRPFMQSRRVRAGRPDTQFFWVEREGHPCVAKQLSVELGPQVADLLEHERQVLRLLNARQAPVCQLVEDPEHPEWLITRFAGLSLQVLGPHHLGGWPPLPLRERVSVWAGFLLRAQSLADLGAVPLDLSDRNLVVPLGPSGPLDLSSAMSIDHAHTVVPSSRLPGGALRRPVWVGAKDNHQLAPEVRDRLVRDQERFLQRLKERHAPLPGTTPAVEDEAQVTNRMWLAYSEDQELQQALDAGDIEAGKVIQYAVGRAIHRHLAAADPLTPPLAAVVLRLCAQNPNRRYSKLEHAADALKAALGGRRALSSAHAYHPELPQALLHPPESSAPLLKLDEFSPDATQFVDTAAGSALGEGSTQMVEQGPGPSPSASTSPHVAGDTGNVSPPPSRTAASGWRYAVAALLALALGWPLGQWLATLSGA